MEMNTQPTPTGVVGTKHMSSNRRPVGSARKRQRARELASAQLSLSFDFEEFETLSTLKPVAMVEVETVRTPSLRLVPVNKESMEATFADRVHFFDRTPIQCSYPLWSDDERNIANHFMCGAAKEKAVTYCCSHMAMAYGKVAA